MKEVHLFYAVVFVIRTYRNLEIIHIKSILQIILNYELFSHDNSFDKS